MGTWDDLQIKNEEYQMGLNYQICYICLKYFNRIKEVSYVVAKSNKL